MRGDFDEDEIDDFEPDTDDDPILCACGRLTCAEACAQCGAPLCPTCFETKAGFCEKHPDDRYKPEVES